MTAPTKYDAVMAERSARTCADRTLVLTDAAGPTSRGVVAFPRLQRVDPRRRAFGALLGMTERRRYAPS
jgi:hypothetical protein